MSVMAINDIILHSSKQMLVIGNSDIVFYDCILE
jgi:hypothetical protein